MFLYKIDFSKPGEVDDIINIIHGIFDKTHCVCVSQGARHAAEKACHGIFFDEIVDEELSGPQDIFPVARELSDEEFLTALQQASTLVIGF